MNKFFLIAAGQEHTRKFPTAVNRRHLYLNYGLLSLATLFSHRGLAALQVQGNFDAPSKTFDRCNKLGLSTSPIPILLSIPSFYALSWAREFARLAKRQNPHRKIIVGGRWVVDGHPELLKEQLGEVDLVIDGLGEPHVEMIFARHICPHLGPNDLAIGRISQTRTTQLDYSLLFNRHEYQPSVEIARGCGMGCNFCQERDTPLSPLKSPQAIVQEVNAAIVHDEHREMTPYFEASMFAPGAAWTAELRQAFESDGVSLQWRTEARVDAITPERIEMLAACGLSILDLGLESASPVQLQRMKKTADPGRYLRRASELVRAAKASGVRVKVNVLLFAGETWDTVDQTTRWLDAHRECITGVSVGPVMVFGWPGKTARYIEELSYLGAVPVGKPTLHGVQELHLSNHIDAAAAHETAREISRRFMDARQFFELKSFSYFPRTYTYEEFVEDALACSKDVSFDTSELERVTRPAGLVGQSA